MAAYSPNFVAGAYSVTFNGVPMGYTEIGFEQISRPSANIIRLDPTGRTPIDALWTGVEDLIVRIESLEWSTTIWAKALKFLHTQAAVEGQAEKAGQLLVAGSVADSLTAPLILAPVTNTAQKTYTFAKAYPLEPVRTIFSAQRLRTTPMGFFCFAASFDATTLIPTLYAVTP